MVAVAGDISDPATAKRVVATAIEHFGHIDTLVNSAGIFEAKPSRAWTVEEFSRALAVNLGDFFNPSQAATRSDAGAGQRLSALVDQPDARVPATP